MANFFDYFKCSAHIVVFSLNLRKKRNARGRCSRSASSIRMKRNDRLDIKSFRRKL